MSGSSRLQGLFRWLLGLFSSVWFGITILALLFVYCSIGSAVPPVRQHWALEMTEFEFFNWWPFDLLIALLVANMVVVTVRRIRFNAVNAGVWMIHSGIVVLALGSVYYFGTKVEGDTPIFRRRAVISVPGGGGPVSMLVRPGNHVTAGEGENEYHFEVTQIQPEYVLQTAGHEGQKAYSVQIGVTSPTQRFIRQVLAGYPEFTEDVIPGQGRAIKALGKALVDEDLEIRLDYEPQTHFFLMDTAALYLRPQGSGLWAERPIEGLPHYHDRYASREEVWPAGSAKPRPVDIEVPRVADEPDPLAEYDVRVTGYLRYAFEESRWVPGGERLNPACSLHLAAAGGPSANYQLLAFDPDNNTAEGGQVVFRWVESEDVIQALTKARQPTLSIEVPAKDVSLEVPAIRRPEGAEDDFQPIAGTDYSYSIRNVVDNLSFSSGRFAGRQISFAIVEIRDGERQFTRWVANPADATQDLTEDTHQAIETDEGIVMSYEPGDTARITMVAGPEPVQPTVLYRTDSGEVVRRDIHIGETLELVDGLALTLRHLHLDARRERRPAIVPVRERDRDARKQFSMIKVEIASGNWSVSRWLPYNHFALQSEEYFMPGRTSYNPRTVRLPDGQRVELLYSRERRALPAPVVLESFELETFQGGLIGMNRNVRDYLSQLRFADASGGWTEPVQMSSNRPAANNGFWFFQNTWDPPGRNSAGMNYTGAGVGNRNGVFIQLLGCCIAVSGMIYAFYVKPIVKRRRQDRRASQAGATRDEAPSGEAEAEREVVGQV